MRSQLRFLSLLLAGLTLNIALSARADVITFDNVFTSSFPTAYVEGSYTISGSGSISGFSFIGDPGPSVSSDSGPATLTVRRTDGTQFSFSSVEYAFFNLRSGASGILDIAGSLGNDAQFLVELGEPGNNSFNIFATSSLPFDDALLPIDTLTFTLDNPRGLILLDNIHLSAEEPTAVTPEPGTFALLATGMGFAAKRVLRGRV